MTLQSSRTALADDAHVRRNPRGLPVLSGGYGRDAYHVGATPPYVVRGEGWRLWDDRGRELIDANGNFTTLIHGNAHPEIVEAAERALRDGASWGIPNDREWQLAERLIARMPALGQVRFTNSGTEAVMSAIRIARGATGRDGIIMTKDGYHGSSDVALTTSGPIRGVPASVAESVELVPVGDIVALRAAFAAAPERFAAIVLDLLPNKAGLVAVPQEFVDEARRLATEHGTLLIIDEVISLRLGVHGLSGAYGVEPDLLTAGKVIGGGLPIGAVLGTDEAMASLDPRRSDVISLSGTFSGNPVSTAAGDAALRLLTEEAIGRVNVLGDGLRVQMSAALEPLGWEARGRGSLVRAFPAAARKVDPALQHRLWWAAYERGVALSSANLVALSTPMDENVVTDLGERLIDAVTAVAEEVQG
jgi:glutamate-1-semialdehyde 2,1-aminomutase